MLTIRIEPRLAPDADLAALLELFCAAAVIADAEPSIHVGNGDDTVCCDFRTLDVGRLWEVLQAQVLDDERLGEDIARSTVVTLVDPAGEYQPRLLHHYDPHVRLDALPPG
jgi:hypothetical protein